MSVFYVSGHGACAVIHQRVTDASGARLTPLSLGEVRERAWNLVVFEDLREFTDELRLCSESGEPTCVYITHAPLVRSRSIQCFDAGPSSINAAQHIASLLKTLPTRFFIELSCCEKSEALNSALEMAYRYGHSLFVHADIVVSEEVLAVLRGQEPIVSLQALLFDSPHVLLE
jgi:hypothetical protein